MTSLAIPRHILGMLLELRRLRRQECWTRAQIQAHQNTALQRLRTHAYTYSPFYREFHAGLRDRPLHELPVLTKAMVNEHFDEIVTDPRVSQAAVSEHVHALTGAEQYLDRYVVNATSGTTGDPTYILFNRREWATVLASTTRYERHVGSFWGTVRRPKMAVVASTAPWHMSALVGATTRSSWLPMLRLDVGEPIDWIVRQLNACQPHLLATYASMAGILAEEQAAGRLRISPARIVSTAEVLSPALRQRVQATWGDIVFDQYGASEGGTLAVECESPYRAAHDGDGATAEQVIPQRGLHVFEDLYILEVVDGRYRPVPPGQYGDKLLLTVLFNYSQPLIRYELGDSVRMSPVPCSCGSAFALIDDIQGRNEEVLRFMGHAGRRVAVHPMVFYRILDATPVHGWQVIRQGDRLRLRLHGDPDRVGERALVGEVRQALERQQIALPGISVEWAAAITRGASGKAKRIISMPEQDTA